MLIGLLGKAGAGKDTAGQHLVTRYGFVRYAFADPMRAALLQVNPTVPTVHDISQGRYPHRLAQLVGEHGWDHVKRQHEEVARLMAEFGMAIREQVHPDVWVEAGQRFITRHLYEGHHVVVTDVRLPNEVSLIRECGGLLVRIVRPDLPPDSRHQHRSDTALDDVAPDYSIVNDGDVSHLQRKVGAIAIMHTGLTPN